MAAWAPSRASIPPVEIDVSELLRYRTVYFRLLTWVNTLGTVAIGSITAWAAVSKWTVIERFGLSSIYSQGFLLVLVLGGTATITQGCAIRMSLPGARIIRLDTEGTHLVYGARRTETLRWDRPGHRFFLLDFTNYPLMVSEHRSYLLRRTHAWDIGFPWRDPYTVLSKEAFDTILRFARSRGARVDSYTGSAINYGFAPTGYRVSGRAQGTRAS